MKRSTFAVVIALLAVGGTLHANEKPSQYPGGNGGVHSLRGATELDVTREADPLKNFPEQSGPIESDYVYQPPLVPHTIRHYEMSLNANKCLSCHSWKNAKESGATKISVTHYQTREGQVLSDVSPRRYFCLQCHVPQADATALIDNEFQRVDALR
ncbi:nitrate reductase cytochrome c-type subunit [Ferrimonas aestuarii]|uniref:Periplasmic nitrate reductase, electron transfer subunit n=2 Tax=Ferrimonas aestuarii TaxID=2569539 RepID=A0A4U1BKY3_9GAMM|nr:nitrate reductase cytochrome c-type subunit [Ferrimonas aestuarii]TKB50732.1 nitrate reductase cytochrome c-type subunit [Ferrimonas aestuarii]